MYAVPSSSNVSINNPGDMTKMTALPMCGKKVQEGKDQEKAQSEKDYHSKNRDGKKTKLTIKYSYHVNMS